MPNQLVPMTAIWSNAKIYFNGIVASSQGNSQNADIIIDACVCVCGAFNLCDGARVVSK